MHNNALTKEIFSFFFFIQKDFERKPDDLIFEGFSEITADYTFSGIQIRMHVDVGNTVVPVYYTFKKYLEPTFHDNLDTINME